MKKPIPNRKLFLVVECVLSGTPKLANSSAPQVSHGLKNRARPGVIKITAITYLELKQKKRIFKNVKLNKFVPLKYPVEFADRERMRKNVVKRRTRKK